MFFNFLTNNYNIFTINDNIINEININEININEIKQNIFKLWYNYNRQSNEFT